MTGNRDMDAEGIPDLDDPINEDEGMIPPRDHPQGIFDAAGDTVAERSRREEPDFGEAGSIDDDDGDGIGGRLLEPGSEDVDAIDDEKDSVATLVADGDGALSAEEAAMHITDSP